MNKQITTIMIAIIILPLVSALTYGSINQDFELKQESVEDIIEEDYSYSGGGYLPAKNKSIYNQTETSEDTIVDEEETVIEDQKESNWVTYLIIVIVFILIIIFYFIFKSDKGNV